MDELLRIIEQLRAEVAALRAENERLRAELKAAYERIAELERAAARQAAPFRRAAEKKIPPEQKKRPGRKPGHRGFWRKAPDYVDQTIEVPLTGCPHCGGQVTDKRGLLQVIEEIPPLRPEVTRLLTWSGVCPDCGPVRSTHPLQTSCAQGAAGVHLGPRAVALAALLNKHLGNTMRGTCKILKTICGLRVTPGGLAQALARAAGKLESDYQALLADVRRDGAVYSDETSWYVGRPGYWLWTFTTVDTTVYHVDDSRGSMVVQTALGDDFPGVLVSDCLATYDPPPYRKHKCLAHHLRALKDCRQNLEKRGRTSVYLASWYGWCQEVIGLHRGREQLAEGVFAAERERLREAADRLCDASVEEPEEARFRQRMAKQRAHLLGCLDDPRAEPTNNRAERALRPAVIARKLSCGNKTDRGRWCWQILASLAATCHQRAQPFVEYVTPRLTLQMQAG